MCGQMPEVPMVPPSADQIDTGRIAGEGKKELPRIPLAHPPSLDTSEPSSPTSTFFSRSASWRRAGVPKDAGKGSFIKRLFLRKRGTLAEIPSATEHGSGSLFRRSNSAGDELMIAPSPKALSCPAGSAPPSPVYPPSPSQKDGRAFAPSPPPSDPLPATLPEGLKSSLKPTESPKIRKMRELVFGSRDQEMPKIDHVTAFNKSMHFEVETDTQKLRWNHSKIFPLIPGKLSFVVHKTQRATLDAIHRSPKLFFFSCDCEEQYNPFCMDFGPVNLGVLHAFCDFMRSKTNDPKLKGRHLVYYSTFPVEARTNAAYLLAAFMMIEYKMTPEEVIAPFQRIEPYPFKAFRDAANTETTFDLHILDCMRGIHKAMAHGYYDPQTFNLQLYDTLDHPLGGDIHMINGKFMAFRGPFSGKRQRTLYLGANKPQQYLTPFKKLGVSAVVRLNESDTYDGKVFESAGIAHYDLEFDDCTSPSPEIVEQWLEICDKTSGVVAVHCRAGLGRTGTLIAIWMMKHHGFTAREAIAWTRIVRPGSVIGPQQHFLEDLEDAVWTGNVYRMSYHDHSQDADLLDSQSISRDFEYAVCKRAGLKQAEDCNITALASLSIGTAEPGLRMGPVTIPSTQKAPSKHRLGSFRNSQSLNSNMDQLDRTLSQ